MSHHPDEPIVCEFTFRYTEIGAGRFDTEIHGQEIMTSSRSRVSDMKVTWPNQFPRVNRYDGALTATVHSTSLAQPRKVA